MKPHSQLRIREIGEFRFILIRDLRGGPERGGKAYFEIRTDAPGNPTNKQVNKQKHPLDLNPLNPHT